VTLLAALPPADLPPAWYTGAMNDTVYQHYLIGYINARTGTGADQPGDPRLESDSLAAVALGIHDAPGKPPASRADVEQRVVALLAPVAQPAPLAPEMAPTLDMIAGALAAYYIMPPLWVRRAGNVLRVIMPVNCTTEQLAEAQRVLVSCMRGDEVQPLVQVFPGAPPITCSVWCDLDGAWHHGIETIAGGGSPGSYSTGGPYSTSGSAVDAAWAAWASEQARR